MSTGRDVVVVGAGVAGLVCARTLARAGLDVVVLERDDAPGGRVRTDVVDGFRLDRGFQVLPLAYPEVQRALDVGRLRARPFARGAVVRLRGRFRRVADPRHHLLRGIRSLAGGVFSPRDLVGLRRLQRGVTDRETVAHAIAGAALSRSARDGFVAPFLRGTTLDARLTTAGTFLPFVLGTFSSDAAVLPANGMGAISAQLAETLDVRVRSSVVAITGSTVTLRSGERLGARAVVVACAGVVDEPAHGWNGVSCISFAAPTPPLTGPWLVLDGEASGPVNNLCVPTEVSPTYGPGRGALVCATVLGAQEPDLDAVRAQLRAWFGGRVDRWSHLRTDVVPHALPAFPPGAGLPAAPRVHDGVYACGDHREHPSLNGALASGRRAAEAVLADLR